ncbi:MAG: metallophosphoesterase [Planctomycetes bacterium]|nr:metallophosphoesterase [Planctomycetota bacterium]
MIRLAHFSDIHLSASGLDWTLRDWFSKRLTSWLNHRFRRRHKFGLADEIVERMMSDVQERCIDHLIFSGDATTLGFDAEVRRAAEALQVGRMPGLAVPGNHDYCTLRAARSGAFERHFAPWQEGRRIGDHRYPFAQQVGPAWLIGVNAATGNRWPWDAAGSVGAEQLQRLKQLLAELGPGLRILVVHYPICLSSGRPESFRHGLRDLNALLGVAHAGGVNLWLHGHRHSPYYFQQPTGASFPVICAGTATQRDLWSYGEYAIDDGQLQAVRRVYDPAGRCFRDAQTFALQLTAHKL